MATKETSLTPLDHDRLAACEETISAGLNTFMDVGSALATIRNERLYRAKFETFEDYCRSKWSMSRQRANQLIDATSIVGDLATNVVKPTHESQVRPLSALPPAERADAWKEATDTAPAGKVTAAHVQSVVDRRTGEVIEDAEIVTTKRVGNGGRQRQPGICTVSFEHDPEAAADAMMKQFAPKFLRAMCACIEERIETARKATV